MHLGQLPGVRRFRWSPLSGPGAPNFSESRSGCSNRAASAWAPSIRPQKCRRRAANGSAGRGRTATTDELLADRRLGRPQDSGNGKNRKNTGGELNQRCLTYQIGRDRNPAES